MLAMLCLLALGADTGTLRAGAVALDVTPGTFPVLVNGGMTSATATRVKTPLHARALVLDDGKTKCAIVIVDSCMMGRPLLDEVKALAAQRTGIATNRMLISATHAHSAPASMGCLGTDADPRYVPFLRDKLVEAMVKATLEFAAARERKLAGAMAFATELKQDLNVIPTQQGKLGLGLEFRNAFTPAAK